MSVAAELKDLADVVALTLEDHKCAAELCNGVGRRPRYGHQLGAVIKHRDEEDDNGGKIDEIKHKIFLSLFCVLLVLIRNDKWRSCPF